MDEIKVTDYPMSITIFSPDHQLWPAYRAHLERVGMARWAQPAPDMFFLGVCQDETIIGHLSLRVQPIIIPGDQTIPGPDGEPLRETYVQTFAVEESYRRQGFGRALQLAALDLTKDLGCYQMRSWSSLDKSANYALKLDLGFAAHPAIFEAPNGEKIGGVYFVRAIQ
jgi:GNAT superfamily N-acetyltransferase